MTEVPIRRPPGTPCWASLMAHRADRSQDFYGALFGWGYVPGPQELGPYAFAALDGRRVAGIGEGAEGPHRPVAWTTMFAADDADHAAEMVRECGGTVGIGPLNTGDAGRVAIAVDPSGAVFGIWQGGLLPGAELTGEPDTVAWSELMTQEAAAVTTFYRVVFGFEVEPPEGGEEDRLVLKVAGTPVAGVRGVGRRLPKDRGAHWMTYFETADVDEVAARAQGLGGSVLEPPHDSRYGRVATLADLEGAAFSVITSARR